MTSNGLTIEVWADIVCPWCYLGEQRLSTAIDQSPHRDEIDLKIRTFQLDPEFPTTTTSILAYLAGKYGVSAEQAREMEGRVAGLAEAEGLPYAIDRPASNTFDMLRLVHLGVAHGVGWEYFRAIQAELFGGNEAAYEPATLQRLGEQLGIPGAEIRDVLATDRYADAVRAEHNEAVRLGANGVPFTVLDRRFGVPGAVGVEQYAEAIDTAWEQREPAQS